MRTNTVFGLTLLLAGCGSSPGEEIAEVDQAVAQGPCQADSISPFVCPNLSPDPSQCFKHCGGAPMIASDPGFHPYRIILNQPHPWSQQNIDDIRAMAAEWTSKTHGVVTWLECPNDDCAAAGYTTYTTITSQAGSSHGHAGWDIAYGLDGPAGLTRQGIAHEMGHDNGLPHEFNRHDRDAGTKMVSHQWCPSVNPGADSWRCTLPASASATDPAIPTGTFGSYEGASVMDYNVSNVCNFDGQNYDYQAGATTNDASNAVELIRTYANWSPFVPLPTQEGHNSPSDYWLVPPFYEIVSGGSPAISSWGSTDLDIFVRGNDGHIYHKYKTFQGGAFVAWSSWVDRGGGFTGDPAAVSWGSGRVDVVAQKSSDIYVLTYKNGAWGTSWSPIGHPSAGVGSAPAISSWGPNRLDAFVRGASDNRLYQATYNAPNWGSWTVRTGATFSGKPSATSWGTNRIDVAVTGLDGAIWWANTTNGGTSWSAVTTIPGGTVAPGSSPAIGNRGAGVLDIYVRGQDNMLWQVAYQNSAWGGYLPLGGLMVSDPAVVEKASPTRIDLAVVNVDIAAGQRGVWWRYYPNSDLKNHYVAIQGECLAF